MDPAQYGFYQQSGNQVMGNQPLSATYGGHVSLQIQNGPNYYAYPPAAPYQGQYYGPQGPYVPAYHMPAPFQHPAHAVPPAAPFAYQASNAIGMQAPPQFPVQACAAHPGSPCEFSDRFQGEDQQAYRALCNDLYQCHGRSCFFVGEDVTRKAIAVYRSGTEKKAHGYFRRRAQKNKSQRKQRASEADAKREAKSQREDFTQAIVGRVEAERAPQAQQAATFRAPPSNANMPAPGQGAGPAMQQPYFQNAVQQPADQMQPQAPHQGDDFVFDPEFDFDMSNGPIPAGLD
jgi:hypothetical protein